MSFKKYRDIILGSVMLAFSGFYLYYAQQIKTRPKLTPAYAAADRIPLMLGVLLAVLSVLCIIAGIRKMKTAKAEEKESADKNDLTAVALTFAVIIAYTLLMQPLGFILSTVLYLFFQMLILAPANKRNYLLFALIAVVFTAIVFTAFRVGLQQLLPRGIFEDLLGF